MSHKHLTIFERENILVGRAEGKSISQIAREIGRNKSTISRELRRPGDGENYSPNKAQSDYHNKRDACKRELILDNNKILETIREYLKKSWSPEQIVGRLELDVSVPTIYRAFNNGTLTHIDREYLRRKGKKYKYKRNGEEKRGKLINCKSIDIRPPEIAERQVIGDWEGDTVLGSPGTGGIVTLVDRSSRYIVGVKIEDKRADTVTDTILRGLDGLPCRSITFDNGKEFAGHKAIEAGLGTEVYFAHPHSPWERGTNENTNGLVREYLPKGSDFGEYTDEHVRTVMDILNNRPRKILDYKTPAEVFLKNFVAFDLTI